MGGLARHSLRARDEEREQRDRRSRPEAPGRAGQSRPPLPRDRPGPGARAACSWPTAATSWPPPPTSLTPRGPLSWLDPGVFGTLGVGGGFALGAKLCRPEADVWILYGDGSVAYSLAEFDTFARHGIPVIAVVGNDAGWTQIAREQIEVLKDDVGTVLARTDYHKVAEGYGGRGLLLDAGGGRPGGPRGSRAARPRGRHRCWSTPTSPRPSSARARSRCEPSSPCPVLGIDCSRF